MPMKYAVNSQIGLLNDLLLACSSSQLCVCTMTCWMPNVVRTNNGRLPLAYSTYIDTCTYPQR